MQVMGGPYTVRGQGVDAFFYETAADWPELSGWARERGLEAVGAGDGGGRVEIGGRSLREGELMLFERASGLIAPMRRSAFEATYRRLGGLA